MLAHHQSTIVTKDVVTQGFGAAERDGVTLVRVSRLYSAGLV